jgi:hypothetical protein
MGLYLPFGGQKERYGKKVTSPGRLYIVLSDAEKCDIAPKYLVFWDVKDE